MEDSRYIKTSTITSHTEESGRKLPYSEELECAVLGALLLEKEAILSVKDLLRPQTFYLETHQIIYQSILDLSEASESVDLINISRELRKKNLIRQIGGTKYLAFLLSKINSATNIEFHASLISQMAIKREMYSASNELMSKAYDEGLDIFDLLNDTEQYFFKISEQSIKRQYKSSQEIIRSTIDELEHKKLNNDDGITGIPSGFKRLDDLTGGWQKSELTIIAARPAMGKTAFVVSSMRNAAVDHGVPVAIFSLEMSATQLMLRMISSELELESEKLKKGMLSPAEWDMLHSKLDKLTNAPIFIDDTPALSILELRAKCRRLKAQHNIQMVIIDYLQLMSGDDGSGTAGNREQEIATISRSLKNLSKELDCPVLALSQLSRAVETRGGTKRPQLSDLRESGSIEQDADMVMFLYRAEYYRITEDENGNSTLGLGEVIIAKNRAGTLDSVPLRFFGQFTKFTDVDYQGISPFGQSNAPMPGSDGDYSHFESEKSSGGDWTPPIYLGSKANTATDDPFDKADPMDEIPF